MKKTDPIISFQAHVRGIKTLVGSGMDVTLSLSDKDIKQISRLLECKKSNVLLEVSAVVIKPEVTLKEKNVRRRAKRVQRYPYRANS